MAIRQGKQMKARKSMEDLAVQKEFSQFESEMTIADFNKACLASEIPNDVLYKIISIDLKLRFGDFQKDSTVPESSWTKLFEGKLPARLPTISFDTVTEFDPDKTKYQNGRWQNPRG